MSDIVQKHAPLKTKVFKKNHMAPWFNKEIAEAKKLKRKLERAWKKTKLESDFDSFSNQRKILNYLMSEAKKDYYSNLMIKHESNPKQLFSIVNKLSNQKKKCPLPDHTCPSGLANSFSEFFKTKIDKIREKFSENSTEKMDYDKKFTTSFLSEFSAVSESTVKKVILQSPSKSCTSDPLPTTLLKDTIDELLPVLTKIVNLSILHGKMPTAYKNAVLTPLIKKVNGERILKNYRPISNLPFISKIIEKCVSMQIQDYVSANKLNTPLQSAYKANHSTQTALLKIFNDILTEVDQVNVVMVTLLDLSAAFDTVNHDILLRRLQESFGIDSTCLKWFESYLTGRSQHVMIKGSKSEDIQLSCCVPQGSVLGPDLYSKYTSPLSGLISSLSLSYHFYADDSQIWTSLNPSDIENQIQAVLKLEQGVKEIGKWMFSNKLQLNKEKTELMIIGTKQQRQKMKLSSIELDGELIHVVPEARNLGVIIDSSLTMEAHVNNVCKLCYIQLKNIIKIRCYLTTEATKRLVQALVISRLDYCNVLFFGISDKLLSKLQKVQNQAARIISRTPYRESITPILKSLHWLPVKARIEYAILLTVYKAKNDSAPEYISDLLKPQISTHSMTRRSTKQDLLAVPKHNLKTGGYRAFSVHAPHLWNNLPQDIKVKTNIASFKKSLKTLLFRRTYN